MTTTCVRDSVVGDDWIRRMAEQNPIAPVVGQDGQPTGNFTTGPVRIAFPYLFKPQRQQNQDGTMSENYSALLLFSPFADYTHLFNAFFEVCKREFPEYRDGATGQYHGIHSPFRDQAEKCAKFQGFTPGCQFITAKSQFKPPVVDAQMNPIVDEARLHAGVWAIASISLYAYGKNPPRPRKGVSFNINTLMVVADDTNLGGGAADPGAEFSGVNVEPPAVQPGAMFGQPGAVPPAPGAPGPVPPAPGFGGGATPMPTAPAPIPPTGPASTLPPPAPGLPSNTPPAVDPSVSDLF